MTTEVTTITPVLGYDSQTSIATMQERLAKARRERLRLQGDHRAEQSRLNALKRRADALDQQIKGGEQPISPPEALAVADTPTTSTATTKRSGWLASLVGRIAAKVKVALFGGEQSPHGTAAPAGAGEDAPAVATQASKDQELAAVVSKLRADIEAIEARINQLAERISNLDAEIAALETALSASGEEMGEGDEAVAAALHDSTEGQVVALVDPGEDVAVTGETNLTGLAGEMSPEAQASGEIQTMIARTLVSKLREGGGPLMLSGDYARAVCMNPEGYRVTDAGTEVSGNEVMPVFRLNAVRDPDTGEWHEAPAVEEYREDAVSAGAEETAPRRGRGR